MIKKWLHGVLIKMVMTMIKSGDGDDHHNNDHGRNKWWLIYSNNNKINKINL
jgi:hypothetical protein